MISDRDLGFYETPLYVSEYIYSRMVNFNKGKGKVLDPAVGKENLIKPFIKNNFEVNSIDFKKYSNEYKSKFYLNDFLKLYKQYKKPSFENMKNQKDLEVLLEDYSFIVANPPYISNKGSYLKENKHLFKEVFADIGTTNTYTMFISAIIDIANPGTIIGLITCDSFFTAKLNEKLRIKILETCIIHEITMCPTDLFKDQGADVRTSILILEKKSDIYMGQAELINTNNRPSNIINFKKILSNNINKCNKLINIESLVLEDNYEFLIGVEEDVLKLFKNKRVGEVFKCITGISTGKDKKYLRQKKEKGYEIPFIKNPGSNKFYNKNYVYLTNDYENMSNEDKNFMVRNKDLLYKSGISCSSMGVKFSAVYLEEKVLFGVNANIIVDKDDVWWLLAYLNSDLVLYLVRGIIRRSNMITSGYVSRIPLIQINYKQKDALETLAKSCYIKTKNSECIEDDMFAINNIIYNAANLSSESEEKIQDFVKRVVSSS